MARRTVFTAINAGSAIPLKRETFEMSRRRGQPIARWREAVFAIDSRRELRTGAFGRWLAWRIRTSPDPVERYRSACLAWDTPRLTNSLVRRARDPQEHFLVRGICLESLARAASWFTPKSRLDKKVHRVILESLRDPHSNVRFWACYAAAQMRILAARPLLRNLREDEGLSCMGWTVGYEATEALKAIDGQPAWDDDRLPGPCPYPPLW